MSKELVGAVNTVPLNDIENRTLKTNSLSVSAVIGKGVELGIAEYKSRLWDRATLFGENSIGIIKANDIIANVNGEYSDLTLNDITFSSINFSIYRVGSATEYTQELKNLNPKIEEMVDLSLETRLAKGLDKLMVDGTGVGQLQGLDSVSTTGRLVTTSATPTLSDFKKAKRFIRPEYQDGLVWVINYNGNTSLEDLIVVNPNTGIEEINGIEVVRVYSNTLNSTSAQKKIAYLVNPKYAFGKIEYKDIKECTKNEIKGVYTSILAKDCDCKIINEDAIAVVTLP